MRTAFRFLPLITTLLVLTSCAPLPTPSPELSPLTFLSPLRAPEYRAYIPFYFISELPKKGVAGECQSAARLGASWYYNWNTFTPACQAGLHSVFGVPMLRRDWVASEAQSVADSNWILGANEPDLGLPQDNISPEAYVSIWRDIERSFPERYLAAPAPSHLHPEWIEQFRTAYIARYGVPPRLDALTVHGYYSTADQLIRLVKHYTGLAKKWGVPQVWVTEWAFPICLTGSMKKSIAESQKAADYFESEPMVKRYAWYIDYCDRKNWWCGTESCNSSLLTLDGGLTPYGEWYANVGK